MFALVGGDAQRHLAQRSVLHAGLEDELIAGARPAQVERGAGAAVEDGRASHDAITAAHHQLAAVDRHALYIEDARDHEHVGRGQSQGAGRAQGAARGSKTLASARPRASSHAATSMAPAPSRALHACSERALVRSSARSRAGAAGA